MPNLFTCKTLGALFLAAIAIMPGTVIAQTPPQFTVDSIKAEEWTANLLPSLGASSAPIKIVFFVDYQCPSCRTADPLVRQAISKRTDVALIYGEFPLVHHPLAKPAAIIAENARAHGTFDVAHKRLMQGQTFTEGTIKDAARIAGVSLRATTQTDARIEADHSLERKVNLASVPSFIVIENGKSTLMNKQQLLDFLH